MQAGFSFRGPVRKLVQKPCIENHWMHEVQTARRSWQRTAATVPYTGEERRTDLARDAKQVDVASPLDLLRGGAILAAGDVGFSSAGASAAGALVR